MDRRSQINGSLLPPLTIFFNHSQPGQLWYFQVKTRPLHNNVYCKQHSNHLLPHVWNVTIYICLIFISVQFFDKCVLSTDCCGKLNIVNFYFQFILYLSDFYFCPIFWQMCAVDRWLEQELRGHNHHRRGQVLVTHSSFIISNWKPNFIFYRFDFIF